MQMVKSNFRNIFSLVLLIVLFLSGSVSMVEEYTYLHKPLAILSLCILFCYLLDIKRIINGAYYWVFYSIIILFFMSSLFLGDFHLFLSASQIALVFIVLSQIIPIILKQNGSFYMIIALLISNLPLIIVPLITEGIHSVPYKGIFYNTNSFGGVVATLYSVFLAIFIRYLKPDKQGRSKLIGISFSLLLLISSLLGVIYSGSRTSFLTVLIVSFIALIIYLYKYKLTIKRINKLYFFILVICSLFLSLFSLDKVQDTFETTIVGKFERKSSDLLDGRSDLWLETIKDINIFGHGSDYFNKFIISPHNTFITLVGYFGISGVIFLVFFLIMLIRSIKYLNYNTADKYNFFPMLMIITFLSLSTAEVMLMKNSMFAAFAGIGIITREKLKT